MSILDFLINRKIEVKASNFTDKEREELRKVLNQIKGISKIEFTGNYFNIVDKLVKVLDTFLKIKRPEFYEISSLVTSYYCSLITKDIIDRIYNHDAYIDTISRLKTISKLLESSIKELDEYKNKIGKLDYKLYHNITMIYSYILVCFRKFNEAYKYANDYYEHDRNEIAKEILNMLSNNAKSESKISKAFMESTHLLEIDSYINGLALTLVDENGSDLYLYEGKKLYDNTRINNVSTVNPILTIKNKLNEDNLRVFQMIFDCICDEFKKKAFVFSIGLEAAIGDKNTHQFTTIEYESAAKQMEELNKKKDYNGAIAIGNKFSKNEDNEDPFFFHQLGLAFSKIQAWHYADVFFMKSYKLDPSNTNVIISLAISKFQNKEYENSILYAEEYIKFKGTNIDLANSIVNHSKKIVKKNGEI